MKVLKIKNLLVSLILLILFIGTKAESKNVVSPTQDNYLINFEKAVNFLDEGNYDEAQVLFEEIYKEESARPTADSTRLASLLANFGTINYQLKLFDKAINYYLRAEEMYNLMQKKDLKRLASVQVNLAICYLKSGDMGKSILHYENSDLIFQKLRMTNTPEYESLLSNFAAYYMDNAEYRKALSYNNRAFQISTIYRKEYLKWISRGFIYYKTKDYKKSIECYNTAYRTMVRDHGADFPGSEQIFLNLGQVYLDMNEFDKALENFEKTEQSILKTSGKSNASYSLCLNEIGQVYQKRSQTTNNLDQFLDQREKNIMAALQYYQRALCAITPGFSSRNFSENPDIKEVVDKTQLLMGLKNKAEALNELAKLLRKKGDKINSMQKLKDALSTYQLSTNVIHFIRTGFVNQESRLFLAENESSFYSGAIDAAVDLFEMTQEPKFFKQAFELSERSRSTDFLTMVRNTRAKQFGGMPDTLLQKESEIKTQIDAYKSFIFNESSKNQIDSQKVELWKSKSFALEQSYDKLIDLFEKKYPKYYELKYSDPIVSPEEIQSSLKTGEALVEYAVREPEKTRKGEIITFLLTREKYRIYRKEIDTTYQNSIQAVIGFLKNQSTVDTHKKDYIAYSTNAYKLYQYLVSPFSEQVQGNRLIFIPDGKLAYLPFDCLVSSAPDTTKMDFRNLKYLVFDHSISYSYSATLLYYYFNHQRRASDELGIFVAQYKNAQSGKDPQFQALPGAKIEADKISKLMDSRIFSGEQASGENFKKYASDFDILHLAMHTMINDSLPMYSKLVFNGGQSCEKDLDTYEIYNMDIKSRLVVLSACNTGSGKLAKGEGVMSLARAFLYAGCPSIVMTLWNVEDETSAELMIDFYRQLLNGYSTDDALRKAKINYIANADPLHAHPHYWLGYVSIGDQDALFHRKTIYLAGMIFFIILSILMERTYVYFKRKKSK